MESWPALPPAPLKTAGPGSEAFLQLGCLSYADAARHLHELPYGRNSDREPTQIGDYKIALHHDFLRGWLRENREVAVTLDELWRIREACIRALTDA